MTPKARKAALERLYLTWDAAWVAWMKAQGTAGEHAARSLVGKARAAYERLAGSEHGIERGEGAAGR